MHVDFVLSYRSVYFPEIKTTNGTPATMMLYTCGSCLFASLIPVYKNLTHGTLG